MNVSMISELQLSTKVRKKLCKTFAAILGMPGTDPLGFRGL